MESVRPVYKSATYAKPDILVTSPVLSEFTLLIQQRPD